MNSNLKLCALILFLLAAALWVEAQELSVPDAPFTVTVHAYGGLTGFSTPVGTPLPTTWQNSIQLWLTSETGTGSDYFGGVQIYPNIVSELN